jgi:formate hydrogenlyase transcriptional activator
VAGQSQGTALKDVELQAILGALQATNWIVGGPKGAAAILGLKRTTLQARMQRS